MSPMPLASGTTLGSYEIVEPVGAGGMGEVYKARDTRLDRIVAIKVLPEHLASDPERRQRFEREARAVSSLNHPHICTLHDVGSQDGVDFLVMEYLDGETLADRLARGPLPLDEAMRHAVAIADALGKAHRQRVVHRDLKPGNVVLTKEGAKLLDFGLAKLAAASEDVRALSSLATEERPLTADGAILGTFQYMAPEQLEGGDVDARSDIFAFGALLYEMVTGKKAFHGKSQASLIAAILEREPESMVSIQPLSPPALERVVRRCLAKDPDERWQSAFDLCAALRWVVDGEPEPLASTKPGRDVRALAAMVVGAAAAALATWLFVRSEPTETRLPLRLALPLGEDEQLPASARPPFDISPDGRFVVYLTRAGGLRLRALDQLESRSISGTEGAASPIFSPDGRFIAFTVGTSLFKVAVEGGEPFPICDCIPRSRSMGTWAHDDYIYSGEERDLGLFRVAATGGEPEVLASADETSGEQAIRWPWLLPNGEDLLVSVLTPDGWRVVVLSLTTGARKTLDTLGAASYPRYLETGHLVYAGTSHLMAVPFDTGRLEPSGVPVPVLADIQIRQASGGAHWAVARNGTLIYSPGAGDESAVVSVDRDGNETELFTDPGLFHFPGPSADGRSLLVSIHPSTGQLEHDLWLYDLARKTRRRLTSGGDDHSVPVWDPGGRRIAVAVNARRLDIVGIEGGAAVEVLASEDHELYMGSWSPDGRTLAYRSSPAATNSRRDIWIHTLGAEGPGEAFLASEFDEDEPSFSPDGRWMAYRSDESGQREVYAVSYPGKEQTHAISRDGGMGPLWSPGGNELFFRDLEGTRMYAVSLEDGVFGEPRLLFEGEYSTYFATNYGVGPDGDTFFMVRSIVEPRLNVVVNWFDELRERVPTE